MKYFACKYMSIVLMIGLMLTIILTSCDEGFEEMNINPNAYTIPKLPALFTYSLIRTVGTGTPDRARVNMRYCSGIMQYFTSLENIWYGDKGIIHIESGDFFSTAYTSHLKELVLIISETEGIPDQVNLNAIAKIWFVYGMHRITDMYGDVPYKEAGLGYIKGIHKPKYDKQSDIYPWMLQDLESAINQLDATKNSYGAADLIYNGDVLKWKKFGNSLMLRLGMRLTKVDPNLSQTWVEKAVSGGVFQSNSDLAKLTHTSTHGNTWNQDSYEFKRVSFPESSKGLGATKIAKTFMELLQVNNDPRIPFYATLWEGNINSKQLQVITTTTLPELQKGLPSGCDPTSIGQYVPGWTTSLLASYSELNTATIGNYSSPSIILSYSEVEFLLAEAALRGWGSGTSEGHYHKAIKANMESSLLYPNSSLVPMAITPIEINNYLATHPLTGTFEEKMMQIHTQFYLAHYMYLDFIEPWSNWRRTGIPNLTPITHFLNSTGGVPIRRLLYPPSESTLNTDNYEANIARQGSDTYLTRVWWDKP